MNYVKILYIVCCLTGTKSEIVHQNEISEEFLVSTAVTDVCEEFFVKKSTKFDLIIYGEKTCHLDDVADGILGRVEGNFSTSVQHVQNIAHWNHNLEDSAVILFSNIQSLVHFNSKAKYTNRSQKLIKLLIYAENYDNFNKVNAIDHYESDKPDITSFEYFIVRKTFTIGLISFNHFQNNFCNKQKIELINIFDKITQKWIKNLESYRNFENFNGCMLTYTDTYGPTYHFNKENKEVQNCMKLSIFEQNPSIYPKMLGLIVNRPDINFNGLNYEIFEAIGKRGNFTTNYQLKEGSYIFVKDNNFINQSITIFPTIINEYTLEMVDMTTTYFDINFGIYVNPSEFYSNFEKLLLSFDATIWILLLVTFISTAIVIFVMRFMPQQAKILLYGHGINTPALNVTRIIAGTSQPRLPQKSIARLVLILFVMFWMILRTCYQSKMFDFITTDMRKPAPKTFDEVINRGYTFVMMNDPVILELLQNELMSRSER